MKKLPAWVLQRNRPARYKCDKSFAGLFCGCGGLDLGALLAGFAPTYAADHDPVAVETYRENIDAGASAVDLVSSPIAKSLTNIDLLLGGPPCQGFSSAGPKNSSDPRNKLWERYLEHIRIWRPKIFIMENVPGFRREFPRFATSLQTALRGRYRLFARRFITQFYGVPQFRDRLIIQGVRSDIAQGPAWPIPTDPEIFSYTQTFPSAISMRDALENLGPPGQGYADHISVELSRGDAQTAAHIPNGGSLKDIPDGRLPKPYHGRERTNGGWTWYYRKPRPELPARGVIASIRPIYATILAPDVFLKGRRGAWRWEPINRDDYTDKKGYYTSPVEPRRLTMRECARLQTFPDWFKFHGSPLQVHRQIGNAVPVEFARRLCEAVGNLIEHGDEAAERPEQPELF